MEYESLKFYFEWKPMQLRTDTHYAKWNLCLVKVYQLIRFKGTTLPAERSDLGGVKLETVQFVFQFTHKGVATIYRVYKKKGNHLILFMNIKCCLSFHTHCLARNGLL